MIVAGVAIGAPISGHVYGFYTEQMTLLLGVIAPLVVVFILLVMLLFYKKDN